MSITLTISIGKFSWTIAMGTQLDVEAERHTVLSDTEVSEVETETQRVVGFRV